MRVNPNPMPDLLAALNQTQLEAQEAALQISTGKSVNVPSDNPVAAGLLVENNDETTFNSGYLQSIGSVQGQLSTADSTLSTVTSALANRVLGNSPKSQPAASTVTTELNSLIGLLCSDNDCTTIAGTKAVAAAACATAFGSADMLIN